MSWNDFVWGRRGKMDGEANYEDLGNGEYQQTVVVPQEDLQMLWKPCNTENHQLEILRREINREFDAALVTYWDVHKWSVDNYDKFWGFLWKHFAIKASRQPEELVDVKVRMDRIPRWFSEARMNYAENLLRYPNDDKVALFYTSERIRETGVKTRTFGELRRNVSNIAASLRKLGVGVGDRVGGYLPNCPEAIEIMAATSSIGAIWSATSPDFGVSGVLDRFRQINPKIIFSVEAVSYNMKVHSHLAKLRSVAEGLGESLEKVVVMPFCGNREDIQLVGAKEVHWSEFLLLCSEETETMYEQLPFDHPLFIMYSSGTTGKPKCIVHGQGGTLMKHLEEHQTQGNRSDQDVLLYYTTVGWMMWNWMVSALALGTSLVLYDGSPLHPNPSSLWDLVDKCEISVFGTSAKWINVQEDRGIKPRLTHKLTSLKVICSTGSPLKPSSYDYVYRDIKTNVLLASISGGTDIISCFMGENSILPVYRGEIQSPCLGCAVECWDPELARHVEGRAGELVCTRPFPSMPIGFWSDTEDRSLYMSAYFQKFDGVWAHGDFILVNPVTKGLLMLGRSDGTLNPNGVRFGSAEIYNIVESDFASEVEDSLCVGQKSPLDGEERAVLFLKMKSEVDFEVALVDRMRVVIRQKLSARHVPALILPIQDIPYTINGKKVEVAVKKVLAGLPINNQGALANSECLELYRNIPETQKW